MRDRIMALAGVFQSAELASSIANTGHADEAALKASTSSLFVFDSQGVADIFGGLVGLRLGLASLVDNLSGQRNASVLQAVIQLLQLGGKFRADQAMSLTVRDALDAMAVHIHDESLDTDEKWQRLGDLYLRTISTLKPRVIVRGNPTLLQQVRYVCGVRSALLCGIRSALLWHQLGGSRLQIILRGRKVLSLARELKTEADARAEHQL